MALVLSMAVLFIYPVILQKFYPQPVTEEALDETLPQIAESKQNNSSPERTAAEGTGPAPRVLAPAEGPFLEKSLPPALIRFENSVYEADFSTLGGSIARLVYKGEKGKEKLTQTVFYEGDVNSPGLFSTRLLHEPADLSRTVFKVNRKGEGKEIFEFIYERESEYRLTKQFLLGQEDSIIALDVIFENLSPREKTFPLELIFGMKDIPVAKADSFSQAEIVAWTNKVVSAKKDKVAKKGYQLSENMEWAGVIKKYFAFMVKPDWTAISLQSEVQEDTIWSTLRMDPVILGPGERVARQFFIYAGPQRYEDLKRFDVGFENLLSRGFLGLIRIWLLIGLKFSHRFTHNFGWDIIIITLLLKGLFAPLTHLSYQSMEKMKALQPKLKALQEKHKKSPEKLNKEMMELYKKYKVNPMAGCLPMVAQIPIFIAFYHLLYQAIELKGAPFIWWIKDLSAPDALFAFPVTLPLLGGSFNLLPIFMLGSMWVQQKMTPQSGGTPEQQKIMSFLPFIFGFIFYNMPSGLVLYWFVNNVLSIIQQGFVKKIAVALHHEHEEE